MTRTSRFSAILAAGAMVLTAGTASAQTEIQWWHAMSSALGEKVEEIAAGFNASQSEYKIVPTYKGNYTETMTAAIAAFRAKKQPHIVQVFEVGTATMMSAQGAVYPVHELMKDAGEAFDQSVYLPAVISYYQTPNNELLSPAIQQLDAGALVQSGRLQEGRARPGRAAQDLERDGKRIEVADGRRLSLRLLLRLAILGHDRELLGLAQPGNRHQGERFRRPRHGVHLQQRAGQETPGPASANGRSRRSSTTADAAARACRSSPTANAPCG